MLFDLLESFHVLNSINYDPVAINLSKTSDCFSEVFSGHASILTRFALLFSDDSGVLRDGNCSIDVVSSAHDDLDTGLLAHFDGVHNSGSEGVLETKNSNSGQILLENLSIFLLSKVVVVGLETFVLGHRHIFVSDKQGSISLLSELFHGSLKDATVGVGSVSRLSRPKQILGDGSLVISALDGAISANNL